MAWMKVNSRFLRYLSLGAALISALPIPLGSAAGIYLWMSPLILLSSVLALKGLSLFNLAGMAVLIASFRKERWFCRYLCPTGAMCELTAKSLGRKPAKRSFPRLGRSLAMIILITSLCGSPFLASLDPLNAFYGFFHTFGREFSAFSLITLAGLLFILAANAVFPSLWCSHICPLGGLQLLLSDLNKYLNRINERSASMLPGRRIFLGALVGGSTGLALGGLTSRIQARPAFRPPGALPGSRIGAVCIRCGSCIKACPTGIIKASVNPDDLTGLLTPILDFSASYCLPECTSCGDVCPSGAIRSFKAEHKQALFIATASIDLEKCLLTQNQECNRCRSVCAYDAIKISPAQNGPSFIPRLVPGSCVGCAACQTVCPPRAIRMGPPLHGES